jgi:uncharacterized membrane protein YfcA
VALFELLVAVVSMVAGATASVAGFGIGSLLTPLVAVRFGVPAAVAIVAIPHAAATCLRAWRLRAAVNRELFRGFGLASAAGGLLGALLFARLGGTALERILGALLLLTALSALSGWTRRVRLSRWASLVLGVLSGFFGGVVGNQGGLRAAALLGLGLAPAAFVATSTLTGVVVDAVRTPLYVARQGGTLAAEWALVLIATAGTVAGTLLGERVLLGLPPERFRRAVAALVGVLGLWMLWRSA